METLMTRGWSDPYDEEQVTGGDQLEQGCLATVLLNNQEAANFTLANTPVQQFKLDITKIRQMVYDCVVVVIGTSIALRGGMTNAARRPRVELPRRVRRCHFRRSQGSSTALRSMT